MYSICALVCSYVLVAPPIVLDVCGLLLLLVIRVCVCVCVCGRVGVRVGVITTLDCRLHSLMYVRD